MDVVSFSCVHDGTSWLMFSLVSNFVVPFLNIMCNEFDREGCFLH